jgi:hypothetical protein
MVTFSIEEDVMTRTIGSKLLVLAIAAIGMSGCVQSELRISRDFGAAVRQDTAAQIADPDAHYAGVPAPGSNGARVASAQHRYETGTVIQPSTLSASSGSRGGFDNGNGGGAGGEGNGASASMSPGTSGP